MKNRNLLLHAGTALSVLSLAPSLLKIGEEVQPILITIGGASFFSFLGFLVSTGREERLKVVGVYLNASLTLLVLGTILVSVGSVTVYVWWDFFGGLQSAPSDSVRVAVGGISFVLTILGWAFYVPFRLPNDSYSSPFFLVEPEGQFVDKSVNFRGEHGVLLQGDVLGIAKHSSDKCLCLAQ